MYFYLPSPLYCPSSKTLRELNCFYDEAPPQKNGPALYVTLCFFQWPFSIFLVLASRLSLVLCGWFVSKQAGEFWRQRQRGTVRGKDCPLNALCFVWCNWTEIDLMTCHMHSQTFGFLCTLLIWSCRNVGVTVSAKLSCKNNDCFQTGFKQSTCLPLLKKKKKISKRSIPKHWFSQFTHWIKTY